VAPTANGTADVNEAVLDDLAAIESRDPSGMLAAVASAGAEMRQGAAAAVEAGVAGGAGGDPPRAVVIAGMGGSGIAGDVLDAVTVSVPLAQHRGYGLPGWVGPRDLVVAVSASGSTEETLSAAREAGRRGARLVTVGAPASPLAELGRGAGGRHVSVDCGDRPPRVCLWALSAPVLAVAHAVGVAHAPPDVVDQTADLLDRVGGRCAPVVDRAANPAKALAIHLAGGLPLAWGSTRLAGVAARRFACQINENAQVPAVWGELPEASHNQVVALDGPASGGLRLVILRDTDEHPQLSRRRAISTELAQSRGVPVTEVRAEGVHPL
jgi:glucose/mannose-6-phosphate isomerase